MAKKPFEDYGKKKVDGQLKDLESRLSAMYDKAGKEVTRDLNAFMSRFNASDILKKEQLQRGEITESQYKDWREAQIFRQDLMKSKIDDLSQKMVNADKEAMAMVNNELPQAYATSYNWGGFRGEKMAEAAGFDYTQFNIVNADAVRILATEDPDLIPWKPMPDEDKDKAWNRKHVQDAIHQGIVQGDSMDKIANRLLPVVNMDRNASIRTARTAVTGVENKARKDATERVREAGIPMVEVWSCTHDSRTRDTHILLDGTEPNDEGLYGEGILDTLLRYPADPSGDPEEVYNCRCGTLSTIKGIDHSKDQELYEQFMSNTYEEDWERVKEQREEKEQAFQANKAGAAERVAERRQNAEGYVSKTENPVAPVFVPAKTIEEAEDYAKRFVVDNRWAGEGNVSYKGLTVESANAINEELTTLFDKYDVPPFRNIGMMNFREKIWRNEKDAPMAYRNAFNGELYFNPNIVKNYKTINKYVADGQEAFNFCINNLDKFSGRQLDIVLKYKEAGRQTIAEASKDHLKAMLDHEFGHHVDHQTILKDKDFAKISGDGLDIFGVKISGYAVQSRGEYIAESFCAYHNSLADIDPDLRRYFDKEVRK